ncbi:hypothetical protein Pla175_27000 [Pirellulimonas nuda]|uniref:Low-density lipoprotein receptor repeat class B n=1 Tax=Pirellulimonas nuda TaxID=2528009 RepID=A0A518DCV6_9BACT|nr:hypothetical protein [Pirellulimonas nuda]QDU89311.1 hypothetical protein Pla175_27000 [Pirellulimonas nuda]
MRSLIRVLALKLLVLLALAGLASGAAAQAVKVFYSEGDSSGLIQPIHSIGVVNSDGTGKQTIHSGLGFVPNLDIDPLNQHIYWLELTGGNNVYNSRIRRSDFNGSNLVDLVVNRDELGGLSLDLSQGKIYWIEQQNLNGPGAVYASDLNGLNIQTIATSVLESRTLEVDSNSGVYGGLTSNIEFFSAPLAGGPTTPLVALPAQTETWGMTVDTGAGNFYWSESSSTGGVIATSSIATPARQVVPGSGSLTDFPLGLDFDPITNKLYWGSVDSSGSQLVGRISYAEPNGASRQTLPLAFDAAVHDVAVLAVPEPSTLWLCAALLALRRSSVSTQLSPRHAPQRACMPRT